MAGEVGEIAKESPEAAGLIYDLITGSMAATNKTIDNLLDLKDEQIKDLATTVTLIVEALDKATVIDRATERRLAMLEGRIASAYNTLEHMERA